MRATSIATWRSRQDFRRTWPSRSAHSISRGSSPSSPVAGPRETPPPGHSTHPGVHRREEQKAAANVAVDVEERAVDPPQIAATDDGVLVDQESANQGHAGEKSGAASEPE